MRHLPSLILISVLMVSLLPGATLAGKPIQLEGEAPPAAVLMELEFTEGLDWYYQNDVGMLLAYTDGRLQAADLLAEQPTPLPALEVPDLSGRGSVVPVARTGVLLVPKATGPEGGVSSYAIDTLGNRVLWDAEPLPFPDVVFSYPDAAMAVMRSFDDDGHVFALDLQSGDKLWDIARRATIIWADGNHVRFVAGSELLTVDVLTGEIVRSDTLQVPNKTRLYALQDEGVILFWKNKFLEGYSLPPAPPAPAAPAEPLWKWQAAGPMMNLCIKGGGCDVNRIGDDLLQVDSPRHHELVRITTGERVLHIKYGMFPAPVRLSPQGGLAAAAARNQLEIHSLATGKLLHEIPYPKGDEGMKTMKTVRWLGEETVMTVYPDKKGNPRKMSGFSATEGKLLWTFVLPEVADYALTGEQRAKLIGRIALSLVATAVSASNPMSVGGTGYYAVFVPNLNVVENLDAGTSLSQGVAGEGSVPGPVFEEAMKRSGRIAERDSIHSGLKHFVIGDRGKYDILAIDLQTGDVTKAARFRADKVHQIAPLTAFGLGLTLEDNHRRLRVIALGPKGASLDR